MVPVLLPAPRQAVWSGGTCPADAPVTTRIDASVPREGYRLSIAPGAIGIVHADAAGLRHARATLAQLAAQGALPCGTVEDHPAFPVRGLMLDCSRDRIPTLEELRRLIRQLASWKMNHLQLYAEHAVVYRGHEEVSAAASPISLDELAALGREAADLGIEVSANQNCFGHLERWFRVPRYEPLAELTGDPGHHHRCGCRSLAPAVPGALALAEDMIAQQAAALPSPLFNIGGDETWDLGKGRSRELVAREGYGTVYGGFLAGVMAAARRAGKRPLFWADIVLHHPDAARVLDRSAIALDWGYSGRHDFAGSQAKLAAAGFAERWVCPGTNCWSSWGGYSDERRANLLRAAREGLKAGATGYLVTCWGDGGHRQIWPASLIGIAEAAHRAWSGTAQYDPRAGGLHAFGSPEMGMWLDALGRVDAPLRDGARWQTAFRALHGRVERHPEIPWAYSGPAVDRDAASPSEWEGVSAEARRLAATLPPGIDPQVAAECRHACALIELSGERGAEDAGGAPRGPAWDPRLRAAILEHRRLWLLRARPGGLDDSAGAFLTHLG